MSEHYEDCENAYCEGCLGSKDMVYYLGDDYECDSCGTSWNRVDLYFGWDDKDNWMLQHHEGCYGGGELFSEEYTPEKLEELFKHFRTYPDWEELNEKEIILAIKEHDEQT